MADFSANTRPFAELDRPGRTRRLRRLAEAALTAYDVPVARLTPLGRGHNTTFRVDGADGHRYVLRVQRPDGPSTAQVRSEMRWLAALRRETGLLVPQPVPTRTRDLVTVVADPAVPEPRACVLCHWVDGRFVDERLSAAQLYAVGELTARLHLHGARTTGLDRGRVDDLTGFGRAQVDGFSDAVIDRAVELAGGDDRVRAAVERVRAVRAGLGFGADVFGLVHGDLRQENYLFHRGRVRAIDFDDCGYGHYAYDLAVTFDGLEHLPQRHELREALLDGYRSVRPDAATTDPAVLNAFIGLRRVQLRLHT
ncbi:phosphotransferase enzyme family protein [Amycolatopsis australiensis]|uniref:Ser/Thr protein kinase RdoA involved in Cpx stress response, MazF antagonist n=1 Tax=Amycolatopsis australiensis TaxID=546364 RepID=A0A1K1R9V5_9PSEU|nr:phosphotransferase [Amycolatopsis australiensis]SFW68864.1 Ser/Thr protein kinase RdoA involved in Cpx stress response, MazF antagonist [Amycolatopsis australiensis]